MTISDPNNYNFEWSEKSVEKLQSKEAILFRNDYYSHIKSIYDSVISTLSAEDQELVRLDYRTLFVAIDSAYLDIGQAEGFHNLNNGVSASKVGASLASWVNRLKPIHFKGNISSETAPFLNSVLALEAGWSVKLVFLYAETNLQTEDRPTSAADIVREMIREYGYGNVLIYKLMWRNPDFKTMSTLFSLLPPQEY
jgi:hypothetical protein